MAANKVFSVVPVTDVAVQIVASNPGRSDVLMRNVGSSTVYLGASDVTAAAGFPLKAGETLSGDCSGDAWYGVCATGQSSSLNVISLK